MSCIVVIIHTCRHNAHKQMNMDNCTLQSVTILTFLLSTLHPTEKSFLFLLFHYYNSAYT